MSFDKYIEHDVSSSSSPSSSTSAPYPQYDESIRQSILESSNAFSNNLQFQMPQFLFSGPPTLAPGGGAEVIPAAMFSNPTSLASTWFTNNGFTPAKFAEDPFFPQKQQQQQQQQYMHMSDDDTPPPSRPREISAPPFSFDSPSDHSISPPIIPYPSSQSISSTVEALESQASSATNLLSFATPTAPLSAPSPLGLPVYSSSGFDLLSVLARVITRPHPKIVLGPVDLSCSFVVVDVRRHDSPIVYCSPTFSRLTGYEEQEVLGRNCRFLQAPDGHVQRGEQRRYTAPEAVSHLKKSLVSDKECQTSIINYKKGGTAFINLVTVIPITGGATNQPHEADEVVYHVGFQVDLTEAPNAILQKLRDGSYIVNYSSNSMLPPSVATMRDRKLHTTPPTAISKDFRAMLADPVFLQSIPIHTATTVVPPAPSANEKSDSSDNNHTLNLLLLENTPDFIHVVSLKGSFLYVAPAVRRVLGYEPEELVGKSIGEFCHPADVVPLMRELKESSATPSAPQDGQPHHIVLSSPPKTVDLLFRARSKAGEYVWMECRGRLHVEPGKGRKAIILSGRARGMPNLIWNSVARAGGITPSDVIGRKGDPRYAEMEKEFWGMLSVKGTFLVVGPGVKDVLGWGVAELVGRAVGTVVVPSEDPLLSVEDELMRVAASPEGESAPRKIYTIMRRKDNTCINVEVVLYPSPDHPPSPTSPIVCQVKMIVNPSGAMASRLAHAPNASVFEELDTTRGSSWQYELQQLKFANQRLVEQIDELEGVAQSHVSSSLPSPIAPPVPSPVALSGRSATRHWAPPSQYGNTSLKRSWDAASDSMPT